MIARIMAAGNGARLHHRIREMYVLDSEDQRIGFMAIDSPDIVLPVRCQYANKETKLWIFIR